MKFYSNIRSRTETQFEILGRILYRRATLIAIILLPIIGYLAYQMSFIKMDAAIEHYLQDNDPALVAYSDFQKQFGLDERIIVGVSTNNIFSTTVLKRLHDFQKDLESQLPYIAKVQSFSNALYIENKGEELVFGELGDLISRKDADNEKFKKIITSSPFYKKQFFSPDEKLAIISLTLSCQSSESDSIDILARFVEKDITKKRNDAVQICSLSGTKNSELIIALKQLKLKYQEDDFQIHVVGTPILRQFLRDNMRKDSVKFISLSLLIIVVFLYILFGRISGVLFPLIIVFCSVSSTVGLMVLLGKPFKAPTMILPSFLIAVGVGASVHIMVIFYQFFSQGLTKQEAIAKALGHSGLPVVLTSLTTAIGLISFSTAKVAPVADLGLFAALGVIIALFYTIIFLPVLISFFPLRQRNRPPFIKFSSPIKRIFTWIANLSTGYPKTIVLFFVGLVIFSCFGITKIRLAHDPLLWLPEQSELCQDAEIFNQHYPGLVNVEILVKATDDKSLMRPEILQKFEVLEDRLAQYSTENLSVFNVFSIADVLKEIHGKLTGNSSSANSLPSNPESIAQELLLLESGSPQLTRQLTDTRFRLARVTVQAPWVDAMTYGPFLDYIEKQSREVFQEDAEILLTGIIPLLSQTFFLAIESMTTSYIVAFVVISGVMILLIGHFKLGLLSMFPNLFPIIFILGFMGRAGIALDMYTMLIGSIALGLAVDDTIHFMYNFRRYFQNTNDVTHSVKLTLYTSGLAMLITTIVLSSGSFIFMASEMRSLSSFGMLCGITIIMALLADFFLTPALMAIYYHDQIRRD